MVQKGMRWFGIGIIGLTAALLLHFLLRSLGVPLYRDFYGLILPLEGSALMLIGALFVGGSLKDFKPEKVFIDFFKFRPTWAIVIALSVTLVLWLVSGKEPEPPPSPAPPETTDVSSGDGFHQTENDPEEKADIVYFSLPDWEEDPFFLYLDKYCGYHVEEDDIPGRIQELTIRALSSIKVIGYYSEEELNGEDSQYASHTARANELYEGYQDLHRKKILLDYQIKMLEDELDEREKADKLYQVSENQKIMGDTHIRLGDIYCDEMNDPDKAHEHYTKAFAAFLEAYRTCVAEGGNVEMRQLLINRLKNTCEKLTELQGMRTQEQVMAPIVMAAFEQL